MKITKFVHEGVARDGKCKGGGAVITEPLIRMSTGEGCGLDNCHCSDGWWISIGLPRTLDGKVEGVIVHFDDQVEYDEFMERHEIIGGSN